MDHPLETPQDPAEKREDRRDEAYALVAEYLGLPSAQRLSEAAPATRVIGCPACGTPIRVADIAPIRAALRERISSRDSLLPPAERTVRTENR